MTDKEKFMTQIIAGLCANSKYVHEATHSSKGLARSLVSDAKEIAEEFFKASA